MHPFENILVYAPLEDEAFLALEQAASLAHPVGARLTVVRVLEDGGRIKRWTQRGIDGGTRFSGTFGAGLKLFPGPRFGLRLEGRWTPTYIKSDAVGWWCDPFWGCYLVGNSQYANQFELSGGVTLRF